MVKKLKTSIEAPSTSVDRNLAGFLGDQRGALIVVVALMLPVLILLCVGVLQYNYLIRERDKVQQTLDQVTMMVASRMIYNKKMTNEQLNAEGVESFKSTLPPKIAKYITSNSYTPDRKIDRVEGRAVGHFPLIFPYSLIKKPDPIPFYSLVSINNPEAAALDVVMCIDTTGSMGNTLSAVKANALSFQSNLAAALTKRGMDPFARLRARVIFFDDFSPNSPGPPGSADTYALKPSPFYDLPADEGSFKSFVQSEILTGGGDLPESGLECLDAAMDSPWTTVGTKLRDGKIITKVIPVIAIYTDAASKPPNHYYSINNKDLPEPYPPSMPRDYAGLLAKWSDKSRIDQRNKMILFYGDPNIPGNLNEGGTVAGWQPIATWPKFDVAGTLTSANTDMIAALADAIAKNTHVVVRILK